MKNCFILLFLATLSHFSIAQTQRLTPEKLFELGRVSLDDVSADGQSFLYGVTYYDKETNTSNRDIYLMKIGEESPVRLTDTPESESNARFRPDGQWIGFLRDGMMYEVSPDGGNERQVGFIVWNGFEYSPLGDRVLFAKDQLWDRKVEHLRKYRDLKLTEARIIDDLMYRHWNSWHDYKYSNVYHTPYRDGELFDEPINIIQGPYDSPMNPFGGMEQISWSPDGKFIAYTCKKLSGKEYTLSTNSDIYLYRLSTRETENLSEGMPGYDMEPQFSPDGRYIVWNSMKTPGFEADRQRIILYDRQTKSTSELTADFPRDASHPKWSADSKTIYFRSGKEATYHLYSLDVQTGEIKQITEGVHNYYDFYPAGNMLIAARASMSMPHEIYSVNTSTGTAAQLTFTNKEILEEIRMGKVEKRWVKTTDGKNMLVWVIYPPGFSPSKRYPALLYCQGGPQSAVSQFWSYRWNFQMMAAKDYIVVAPNRRGLPTFGREWNDQISGDWGGQAERDLLTAIDELKKERFIDENRLGAVGASYGGYSVYWLAGNHQKRFKAFISHCGLFNLQSWYGTTEEMFFANHDLEGPYWKKPVPKTYLTNSPHLHVNKWDTPILIIHCQKDYRVPVTEGIQAFQAAQLQGIPSRFLYFPDEGHWVTKPQNAILWQRVFFDWLDEHVK